MIVALFYLTLGVLPKVLIDPPYLNYDRVYSLYQHTVAVHKEEDYHLKRNCRLVFSKGHLFECVHLINDSEELYLIHIRPLNAPGHIKLDEDKESEVIMAVRGSGACNGYMYFSVHKITFEENWLDREEKSPC
jgi:hypothetical protein